MRKQSHMLLSPSIGTQRQVMSFHYGTPGAGEKIYLQGSLHADELPGMLVLHHLKKLLAAAEARQAIHGEIVIVPVANPIGLSQTLMHDQMGRFEFSSGENFNRRYSDLGALIVDRIEELLGDDEEKNKRVIRQAMREAHDAITPYTELESLRHTLQGLALDADVVLDLHCDFEAVLHVYSEPPYWTQAEPLTRFLGAQTVLLAKGSGGASFDEALSGAWWRLDEHFGKRFPIPMACMGATVELRGEADVYSDSAALDAMNLFDWLQYRGVIEGERPKLPPMLCEPTPLAGSETLRAPVAGVVAFLKRVGEHIEAGEVVAEIVDPLEDTAVQVRASVSGTLYARENRRYATRGMNLCKIAGIIAFRSGYLLSA